MNKRHMNVNILAIYANHDANITVRIGEQYRIFEIERLMKQRYFTLSTSEDYRRIYDTIVKLVYEEFGNVSFDVCITKDVPQKHKDYLNALWEIRGFIEGDHHWEHAAGAFALSGYPEALIVSYDDGGWDNGVATYFNIYHGKDKVIKKLKTVTSCKPGGAYDLLAIPLSEVKKTNTDQWGNHALSFAGKKMGLAAYGKVNGDWFAPVYNFYKSPGGHGPRFLNRLNIGLELGVNTLSGQDSYDLAATSQHVFEQVVMEEIYPFFLKYNSPIVMSGGCALNVLLNEKLRKDTGQPIFIPPNPNDCGLSFGMIERRYPSETTPDITYKGFPILDMDKLQWFVGEYGGNAYTLYEVCELLDAGKIIGVVQGDSEVGPRALGNRSILCDPSYPEMKDILNAKVKYREWFRPFAPVVRYEDRQKYFDMDHESPYMSFAPQVKEGVNLPAITHEDGSARVQTVTREQHEFLYDLLGTFGYYMDKEVLLNTSFNIKGKPILTTIEDAFEVLHSTEMDCLIIENYLFRK